MPNNSATYLRNKYDFRSDVLDIIISGKSTLDSHTFFHIDSLQEVDDFIKSYGYDLEHPIEKAEVFGNFHESLDFIRKHFLHPENPEGIKLEVPRKILELRDVRELFLFASLTSPGQYADNQGKLLQNWACAIIKVMHTISHIDKDLRTSYFADIQTQIFDRFYKLIHRDGEEKLFLGDADNDPMRVDLLAFETKPKKSRDSLILKLLHKPENVAEDIFDQVGIRFITYHRIDALRVIKFLKDKMVVMAPNIKPSRSRNTLLDLTGFREKLTELFSRIDTEPLEESDFRNELEESATYPSINPENPHSSEFYRAIQFTSRQLIKLKNPLFSELKGLKKLAKSNPVHEDILKVIDKIDLKYIQKEIRFFYPFEVQISDQKSHEENEKGRSAHSQYKKAQITTAMNRIMGNFFGTAMNADR